MPSDNRQSDSAVSGSFFSWSRVAILFGGIVVLGLLCLVFFRVFFVNWVDNYEMAYMYDALHGGKIVWLEDYVRDPSKGKVDTIPRRGYVVSLPFVQKVHTIDVRPSQVCINANMRVLNCKLVQFNTAGRDSLLAWHGRDDYDIGAFSSRDGSTSYNNLSSILMSYAYDESGLFCPFLTIVNEFKSKKEQEGAASPQVSQ